MKKTEKTAVFFDILEKAFGEADAKAYLDGVTESEEKQILEKMDEYDGEVPNTPEARAAYALMSMMIYWQDDYHSMLRKDWGKARCSSYR